MKYVKSILEPKSNVVFLRDCTGKSNYFISEGKYLILLSYKKLSRPLGGWSWYTMRLDGTEGNDMLLSNIYETCYDTGQLSANRKTCVPFL